MLINRRTATLSTVLILTEEEVSREREPARTSVPVSGAALVLRQMGQIHVSPEH